MEIPYCLENNRQPLYILIKFIPICCIIWLFICLLIFVLDRYEKCMISFSIFFNTLQISKKKAKFSYLILFGYIAVDIEILMDQVKS